MTKELLKNNKIQIFYWLIAMLAISLPFPDYSLSSKMLGLLGVFWLFYNSFSGKKKNLLHNKWPFLAVSITFFLALIGLLYTDSFSGALIALKHKVLLFVIPLIIFSTRLHRKTALFVLQYFSYAVVLTSLFSLIKGWYFKANYLGDYLYYDKFSMLIQKHTTYYALFVVLALLFYLYDFLKIHQHRFLDFFSGIFLIYILYILSNRISLVALGIGGIILGVAYSKSKQKWLVIVAFPLLAYLLFTSPHFVKRFKPDVIHKEKVNDFKIRELHWKSVYESILHKHPLIGIGTGGNRQYLYQRYKHYGLTAAYDEKYNAHNQFLETALAFGWLGLLLFIFSLVYMFWIFIREKDFLAISIFASLLVFMMTESILQRQSGLIVFALFISLFLYRDLQKPEAK